MARFLSLLLLPLLLITISKQSPAGEIIDIALDVADLAVDVLEKLDVFDEINGTNEHRKKLRKAMQGLNSKLSGLNQSLIEFQDTAMKLLDSVNKSELVFKINKMSDLVTRISISHSRMMNYFAAMEDEGSVQVEDDTLKEFATWCVSDKKDSVISMIAILQNFVNPDNVKYEKGIFRLIDKCNENSEALVNQLHDALVVNEMKAYTMIQYSYALLTLYNIGKFKKEINDEKRHYKARIKNIKKEAINGPVKCADKKK